MKEITKIYCDYKQWNASRFADFYLENPKYIMKIQAPNF